MIGFYVDPNSRRNADADAETSENVSSHEPSLSIAHSTTEVNTKKMQNNA